MKHKSLLLIPTFLLIGVVGLSFFISFRTNKSTITNSSFQTLQQEANRLFRDDQFEKASHYYQQALQIKPNDPTILFHLALTLFRLDRFDEAAQQYQKLITLTPANARTSQATLYCDLGIMYAKQMKLDDAIATYQRALEKDPKLSSAHMKLAYAYLMTEQLEKAWHQFSFIDEQLPQQPFPCWDGSSPAGKKIIVRDQGGFGHCSSSGCGLGDLFHYLRYVEHLKKRGAQVVVEARPEIIPLLTQCPYIDTLIKKGSPLPPCDYCVATGKLEELLNITLETIPHNIPYLYAHPTLQKHWQSALASDHNFKIGITWQAQHYVFANSGKAAPPNPRTMPAHYFLALAQQPNVTLYSLQKINGEEELVELMQHKNVCTFPQDFDQSHGRFMDTAAVMQHLDLVITIDTSIAHLAGALGVPVWVMLPFEPDWRWFMQRTDSPWYPTMRLFRQPKPNDWNSVMTMVVTALESYMKNKK